jgi:hypothetical protein
MRALASTRVHSAHKDSRSPTSRLFTPPTFWRPSVALPFHRYHASHPSADEAGIAPVNSFAGVCTVMLEVCKPFLDPSKPTALKIDLRYLSEVCSRTYMCMHVHGHCMVLFSLAGVTPCQA